MTEEKKSTCCSKSNNCYAVIALCVSFLVLGMLLGNCMAKCGQSKKCNKAKRCHTYDVDGKAGSTCTWSKEKACAPGCEKECCAKKEKTCAPGCEKECCAKK